MKTQPPKSLETKRSFIPLIKGHGKNLHLQNAGDLMVYYFMFDGEKWWLFQTKEPHILVIYNNSIYVLDLPESSPESETVKRKSTRNSM